MSCEMNLMTEKSYEKILECSSFSELVICCSEHSDNVGAHLVDCEECSSYYSLVAAPHIEAILKKEGKDMEDLLREVCM